MAIVRCRENFEKALPRIPYIGGDQNSMTPTLILGAIVIPLLKELLQKGIKTRVIGEFFHNFVLFQIRAIPKFLGKIYGRYYLSTLKQNYFKKMCKWSQENPFSFSWSAEFIPCIKKEFHYGLKFTQCGWVEMFKDHGMEALMPYMCLGYWAAWNIM
ncbi:MAG: L-2-amino-thiazoline-4-carboxylic acid hydrolase [Spirochaetales bacterium]|nr:L-2-amino-thiazoline-4-carboxylic acid hydrolase [Spirochaetales bacterium]